MVKFIVELSEGYIRERANLDNMPTLIENADNNVNSALNIITDYLVFSSLKREIEKGNTEFKMSVNSIDANDPRELQLFNDTMSRLGALELKNAIFNNVSE